VSRELAGERAVMVGYGSSGRAAARALVEHGADVVVSEAGVLDQIAGLPDDLDVDVRAGGHRPEHLDGATVVVVSPGVPDRAPVIAWARERGLPIWSEVELAARLCRVPYVAITGTNGKTTATELVAAMMQADGLRAIGCGNVGYPFSAAIRDEADALAVEVSSFQLRFTESLHPRVSALLNIAPDHLDWHGSFEAYRDAKAKIYARQGGDDVHVGNGDDPQARDISFAAPCVVRWFREGPPAEGEVGVEEGAVVGRMGEHRELGRPPDGPRPFLADAAAAAAVAVAFGISEPAIKAALDVAEPGPHRGTVVARLGDVRFIDDSKATNPHAALAALEGLSSVVLIAGGVAKGLDLTPLGTAAPKLAAVVALGEAAPLLQDVFAGAVPVRVVDSMEEAVAAAAELVPANGTVLLAPACASFDQFRNYQERGERFAAAARRLTQESVRARAQQGVRRA
jgi:UDP-N-acetylmuramoylalanine--D-glutamate ligase